MKARLLPYRKLSQHEHRKLRERLDQFYDTTTEYTAFQALSDQRHCWEHVIAGIRDRLKSKPAAKLKVLEVGAGKTGFGRYLAEHQLRDAVEFHGQDVTRSNEQWLRGEADAAFFGDISTAALPSGYDIVFSTYVLEHVTDPPAHLEKIWSLLADGDLFIFSPRYDLPGYVCPSARHLSAWRRLEFSMRAVSARLLALFLREPQFLIQTDLAAFHGPFFLDADAVHWVSLLDLKIWATRHKASCQTLPIGTPAFPSKDWLIKRLGTAAVRIHKS
jgi:2-polyprenyl-3-methyl-5-hydroxy-6-metoxy-1,4-benzoquinol methylase